MEKNVDSVHSQHFSPFFFFNFIANYPLDKKGWEVGSDL